MAFVTPLPTVSSLAKINVSTSSTSPRLATLPTRRVKAPSPPKMLSAVPDVLANILLRKQVEVDALKAKIQADPTHPIADLLSKKGSIQRKKHFFDVLDLPQGTITVIAEIKRRSPSKGHIANIKNPANLSRAYYDAGAAAISVLTDLEGFGGTLEDLRAVAKQQAKFKGSFPGPCPILRKDFVIDQVQIAEAASAGASAVLLIVAALGKERTQQLLHDAHSMGLDALVEVHDETELNIALDVGADIIGINNRNLHDFTVSLENSFRLVSLIPDGIVKVAESGISDCLDVWKLRDAGFNAVLVGEALVKANENSATDSNGYTAGFNEAKGLISAYKKKGSVEFGNAESAAFFGKGEGASERLGELSI